MHCLFAAKNGNTNGCFGIAVVNEVDFTGYMLIEVDGGGTWNKSKSDPAELYDSSGKLVDTYND
ncbi:hypothetical protein [Acetobacterium tundrae]|uniref:Uncharacterized protein n=1 Tax=Acetobacterium tundrae TaxID=132932 RepID=A0ABR6WP36_9FIRM|nr:hypothetical protein [Acetobacterium tundrae]MBC3798211.1 hypothetical protein [Acetobacterium tundrae]